MFPLRSALALEGVRTRSSGIYLTVPPGEEAAQQWEFDHIFGDDPYQTARLAGNVKSVLDVGGNVGFFSLLARHRFPHAVIHAYEPDPAVFHFLQRNTSGMEVVCHQAAVASTGGRGCLEVAGSSLQTRVRSAEAGNVEVVAFAEALARLGGSADLLKLDCEGGEWSILTDHVQLRRVRHLAMEFHLTGTGHLPVWELVRVIAESGFRITSLRMSTNPEVGLLTASNGNFQP